jgi:hypothetical protein
MSICSRIRYLCHSAFSRPEADERRLDSTAQELELILQIYSPGLVLADISRVNKGSVGTYYRRTSGESYAVYVVPRAAMSEPPKFVHIDRKERTILSVQG